MRVGQSRADGNEAWHHRGKGSLDSNLWMISERSDLHLKKLRWVLSTNILGNVLMRRPSVRRQVLNEKLSHEMLEAQTRCRANSTGNPHTIRTAESPRSPRSNKRGTPLVLGESHPSWESAWAEYSDFLILTLRTLRRRYMIHGDSKSVQAMPGNKTRLSMETLPSIPQSECQVKPSPSAMSAVLMSPIA